MELSESVQNLPVINEVKEAETADAVFPTEKPTKVSDWKRFIRKNIPDFKGNINGAAKLMFAFQKGSEYIYNKFSPKFGAFKRPDIIIVLNEAKTGGAVAASIPDDNKIFIGRSFLEENSVYKANSYSEIVKQDGTVAFKGKLSDFFGITGVEETHHQLFSQIKNNNEKPLDPNRISADEYDAQETEYRALRWQKEYAVISKMSQPTISLLEDRLKNAQKVRSKGLDNSSVK